MRWYPHGNSDWKDLDELQESSEVGRRLEVVGIVFADALQIQLTNLSVDYIAAAWHNAQFKLRDHEIDYSDMRWGMLHGGSTHISGLRGNAPGSFTGWTSRHLAQLGPDSDRTRLLDVSLAQARPSLRCAYGWRSYRWRISPDDYSGGLRLIEALWPNELSDWAPDNILDFDQDLSHAYVLLAAGIKANAQQEVDRAVEIAKATYSSVGYRIVVRGYRAYLTEWKSSLNLPIV